MKREQALAKNTAILMFGKICTQSISFLLLPLYTSILSTSEYGIFDLMITYSALLLPIVNWQFDQGLFRFILDKRGDYEYIGKTFSTISLSSLVQSVFYVIVLCTISTFHKIENVFFLATYVVLHVFIGLLLQFSRGIGKNNLYAFASFLSATSTVVFNVVSLTVLHMGVNGLFVSSILGQAVTLVYLIVANKTWKYIDFRTVDKGVYISVCRYAFPLIPNNLAWWVVNASDRIVIKYFLGVAINGIYTVAAKFPSVFINFYNIVNLSWTESVSLHFEDEDRDVFLSEVMTVFFKIFASCCFLIIAVMPFAFPILVNHKFADSYNHIYILMMAMLFRVMVGLYSCIYIAQKSSRKVATTSIAAAVINLSVDLLLVKKISLYAASISTLVAFASMFVVRYIDVNKTIKMRIENKTLLFSLVVGLLLGYVYYSGHIVLQAISLIGVIVYAVILNYGLVKSGLRIFVSLIKK